MSGIVALHKLEASALDTESTVRNGPGNAFVVDTHSDEASLGITSELAGYRGDDALIDQWFTAHCAVAVAQIQGREHAG